ncbi:mechanosensitive ion channel family protein [Arachidicoccus sp.]|jgi:small conductance mechanosensitive channel|uniref:mechanosensitive ion channel family protein n=1 Tax=Arachidicoccus sp. TaxID=1872624 RepID=UPI003D21D9A7
MKDSQNILTFLKTLIVTKGLSIVLAVIFFFVGRWLIKIIIKLVNHRFESKEVDISLRDFLRSIIRFGLYILLILTVVSMMGIETTSFLTVIGAAGLSIGLALQGSLSNFAGGVLILLFKPFRVGEYISSSNGVAGTVEKIDILYTTLKTGDGIAVYAPNGPLANAVITNYSQKETRCAEYIIGISYDSDIQKAREVILSVLEKDKQILQTPAPQVNVNELASSSVNLSIKAWINTTDYWTVLYRNRENIKIALDKNNIPIPFPQSEMRILSDKKTLI